MPKAEAITHMERVGWGMGNGGSGKKSQQRGQEPPAVCGALERSTEHLVTQSTARSSIHDSRAGRSDTWAISPERLQGAEDLLGLGNREPTPQPKLRLGLQRCVKRDRDLLGSGGLWIGAK